MLTGAENQVLTDAADTLRNYRQLTGSVSLGFLNVLIITAMQLLWL